MARLAGVNIPDSKIIKIALTYIYGIGKNNSELILTQANVDSSKRAHDLTTEEIERIRQIVEKNYKVEGDLRSEINQNIKRLKEINSFRGTRHAKKLPSRGQRTKTNARTKRGKRVCVGSGRRAAAEKT